VVTKLPDVANQYANPLAAILRSLTARAASPRVRAWAAALLEDEAATGAENGRPGGAAPPGRDELQPSDH
jgi:hypothetical protein